MEYKLIIEEYQGQKQIHAIVTGSMDEQSRNNAIRDTVAFVRKENIPRLIWDVRDTHLEYSLTGSHIIITQLKDFGLTFTDHLAIVYKNDKEQHQHGVTAALNRYNNVMGFYDDIEAARKWLLQFK
jgi:hypothetical protein